MNQNFTGSYLLHQSNPLTNIAVEENVQPRVFTFAQKTKSQINAQQIHQDTWKAINDSPVTHPLFSTAPKVVNTREECRCKPVGV